jgi:hypothetical protein
VQKNSYAPRDVVALGTQIRVYRHAKSALRFVAVYTDESGAKLDKPRWVPLAPGVEIIEDGC